jgi:peptide deformylase
MSLHIETGTDNPILRKRSEPVKDITKQTLKLIKEMEKAMAKEQGVGLAAPQVGDNIRLILVLLNHKKVVAMINPEFLSRSVATNSGEEGCLSLPGQWGQVERFNEVTIRYLDPDGKDHVEKLSGFNARVVQHEIDHLDGILFTDHLATNPLLVIPRLRESERL